MIKASDVKLTTLVENTTTGRGLLAEHGLSVLVQAGDTTILVDTGGSGLAAVTNAAALGVDLRDVDTIVLSHGHWDHTGGLVSILTTIDREIAVLAHPGIWDRKGVSREPGHFSYAGIPFCREELERVGARFQLSREPTWISEDIVTSGEEDRTTDFEKIEPWLALKKGDDIVFDEVIDDQSLYIRTDRGLVVVLGCAHRGVINVVRHGMKLTGMDTVHLVVGGTHLAPASAEQLAKTIEAIQDIDVQHIGVSHCTGQKPAAIMARELGDRFFFNNCGTVLQLPL